MQYDRTVSIPGKVMTPTTIDCQQNTLEVPQESPPCFSETGWHEEVVEQPDGTVKIVWTALTEAEFLHPREGDHLPINTFHDDVVSTLKDLIKRWFKHQPNTRVFSDLLIKWDVPLGDHSPDICVVFNLKDPERHRSTFVVAEEGVRPAVVIEVVSPRYRNVDRETKVLHYAQAGVREYIIIDQRSYQGGILGEVIGYQLTASQGYQPIKPDHKGRILSRELGLLISCKDGQVVLENPQTEVQLLTPLELEWQAEQERQRAEQEQQRAEQERQRAEIAERLAEEERQRAKQLADFLRSQGFDPDKVKP